MLPARASVFHVCALSVFMYCVEKTLTELNKLLVIYSFCDIQSDELLHSSTSLIAVATFEPKLQICFNTLFLETFGLHLSIDLVTSL